MTLELTLTEKAQQGVSEQEQIDLLQSEIHLRTNSWALSTLSSHFHFENRSVLAWTHLFLIILFLKI